MSLKDLFRPGVKSPAEKRPEKDVPESMSVSSGSKLMKEDFFVVGVSYYPNSIKLISSINPDWKLSAKQAIDAGFAGQKIFRYSYINKPVKLIPEPDNPEDKNAIAVYIAGEKVGHISREDNVHVGQILRQRSIKYITASVKGGEYKVVSLNGDSVRIDGSVRITVRIAYS